MSDIKVSVDVYNGLLRQVMELESLVDLMLTPEVNVKDFESKVTHGGYYKVESSFNLFHNPIARKILQKKMEDTFENVEVELNEYIISLALGGINFEAPKQCLHCHNTFDKEHNKRLCMDKAYCQDCCPACEDYREGNCYYLRNR